jgi:gluconate 5-dehydrogenase
MIEKLFNLSGKVALITGGTHGIGLAMAKALAYAGAEIIINGHTPKRLENAIIQCREEGLKVSGYLFDITNEKDVVENIEKISNVFGSIDILINNAAVHKRIKLIDYTYKDFQDVVNVNLNAQFLVAREVAQIMIKQGSGKIINMCSMMSELGRETTGAYAAAKGGLKMLTRSMATEWAEFNIQVNGIGPGYIKTDATGPIADPGNPVHDFIIDRTPTGRWGKPEDLQGAALFLASKASDYVNGQIIFVDGGILATLGKPPTTKKIEK